MVVVKDHDPSAGFGRADHHPQRVERARQPLQDACGGDDVELRAVGELVDVTDLECQPWNAGMRSPGFFDQRLIEVGPYSPSLRRYRLGDPPCDRSRPTADVEHAEPGAQEFCQPPVPCCKREGIEYARTARVGRGSAPGFSHAKIFLRTEAGTIAEPPIDR